MLALLIIPGNSFGGTAYLDIVSELEGVDIYINGRHVGKTPLTGLEIPYGLVTINASKKGYGSASHKLNIKPDEIKSIIIPLEKSSGSKGNEIVVLQDKGSLLVINQLGYVPVYIDGDLKGKGSMSIVDMSTGYHQLKVGSFTKQINIFKDYKLKVRVNMNGIFVLKDLKNIIRKEKEIVKLRSNSKELWRNDTENMLRKYIFFKKEQNEGGYFTNDFVDNGDGTVTDRASGLMWEKGGSSSALYYWETKGYISHLNKKKCRAYDDWRIPTLEELCSLLEHVSTQGKLHINPLFNDKQSKCWSTDRFGENPYPEETTLHLIVDFTKGETDKGVSEGDGAYSGYFSENYFIKAVRTIK